MSNNKHEDFVRKTVEAPAELLQKTIEVGEQISKKSETFQLAKKGRKYWHMLGPGLTTGASDDDPSGITTYSQTGAQYGFQLLWLAGFTFPLMAVVQEMCARIGIVTGRGLAGNIRMHFSKKVIYISSLLLLAANIFNIGADLGAMAKATQLIWPEWRFGVVVLGFTVLSLILQVFTPYAKYARYLKWLALVLLAYVVSALLANLNWGDVLTHAVVPSITFSKEQLLLICAILGTTISPYLFFWQTSQEVEEKIMQGQKSIVARQNGATKGEIKNMRVDVWSGMLLSNIVMFFIIAACGALLFPNGITEITSAAQAAEALRPFAGEASYVLFAVGIIGTGMLAIPVLAGSASYALSESFRWKEGLYRNLKQAHAFYGVIILAMLIGLGLNFVGLDPIKALIYSAVANGVVAPIILFLIVRISSNKKIMGDHVNKPSTTAIGWLVTGIMAVAGAAALYSIFF
jgi:NRAMP (natural resistance-associated macrophage protein)-like metal ion transporter